MASVASSDPRSSLGSKAKPNSDTRIYGKLEGLHAIGETNAMPSDSTRRLQRSSTRRHHERSSSRLDTSVRSESYLRTKTMTENRRRRSTSAIAIRTARSYEMITDKSATEILSSPAESSGQTMTDTTGSSEQTMGKRGSSLASEIITNTPESSKSSSGTTENKMRRRSPDFISSSAGSFGKDSRTSSSIIIPSTAGPSQKKKSSPGSSEKKFSVVSPELITSTVELSERKMSKSASDVVGSRAGSSKKKTSRAALEIITDTNGSSETKATRAASELLTCTDEAFDKAMKRSAPEIITSTAGSSERTKRCSDASEKKKKSKSASEKVKSRTDSSEKKTKSKSIDPLGTSLRSTKSSIPVAKSDGFDSTHKERTGRKLSKQLGEEPEETATLTVMKKTDEIPTMNAKDVGAQFFEHAYRFNDDWVSEPSLNHLEARRQKKQVEDTQQRRKTRSKSIPRVSIDFLIPNLTDTPMSGISMDDLDWEEDLYKKSCLDLGGCAPTDDAHEQPLMTFCGEEMESLVARLSGSALGDVATRGISKPYKITAKTDVQIRRDLDALRELDRKLTSLLSLETRRRLRQVAKPRPTLDELIVPQGSVTPMSDLSMDGTELLEGHVKEPKESILNLGSSPASFDTDDISFPFDLADEVPEVRFADKEKRSQRKLSLRSSSSCKEGISISDENVTLQRRRTLRRSDQCKERVGSKEPEETDIADAKDYESYEIPIRDHASTKVRLRKTASTQREGRNPSSQQCLDETRHSRQLDNERQSKSRHKEKSSKSHRYFYDLHIPRRSDPPLSGISMSDLEWVEDLYSTIDVHPGLT